MERYASYSWCGILGVSVPVINITSQHNTGHYPIDKSCCIVTSTRVETRTHFCFPFITILLICLPYYRQSHLIVQAYRIPLLMQQYSKQNQIFYRAAWLLSSILLDSCGLKILQMITLTNVIQVHKNSVVCASLFHAMAVTILLTHSLFTSLDIVFDIHSPVGHTLYK